MQRKIKRFLKKAAFGAEIIEIIFGVIIAGVASVGTYNCIRGITNDCFSMANNAISGNFDLTIWGKSTAKSGLVFSYDPETGTVSDVKIKFGAAFPASLYDENAEYGVIILPGKNTTDFSTLTEEDITNLKNRGIAKDATKMVKAQYDSGNFDTLGYNWVIRNTVKMGYNYEFRAASYIIKDGKVVITKEERKSVKSVAEEQIKNPINENHRAGLQAIIDEANAQK